MESINARSRLKSFTLALLAGSAIFLAVAASPASAVASEPKTLKRAEKALRAGDYEVAEKLFRELLEKDALDSRARLGLSFALLKQRLIRDAYDHAAKVISNDPLSARAHALLGSAILASGDFRRSVGEFRAALNLKDDEPLAISGLAMVDFYENRLESAIRGLRRAVSLDSREPDYIFNLGQAAARSEMYKEAADAYERFLAIAPKADEDRRARIRGLIAFLRYLGNQGSLYVIASGNKTNVAFETYDGRPILKVRVNGRILRFVLDTGSGMSVISDVTAKKLGLRPVARGGLARAVGGGGKFEIVYGFLSSLEVGDVKINSVPVYIRHFYDENTGVDGYLGLSVISRFIASLDYRDRTFALRRKSGSIATTPEREVDPGSGIASLTSDIVEIPLRTTASGFLSGEVLVNGIERPLNFIIDTGASISVVSTKLTQQEDFANYFQPTRLRVFGAAGVAEDVKTVLLPRVRLGTFAREQIRAAVLDMEPLNETSGFTQNGILGANFLRHFRVSFDFQGGLMRLEPVKRATKGDNSPAPQ